MNTQKKDCIGIICGSGWYPKLVAESCIHKNLECCFIFINGVSSYDEFISSNNIGITDPDISDKCLNFTFINLGEIESAINFFHRKNVKKVVFAGAIKRPNFNKLSLDRKGRQWLIKLGKAIFYGDDALLKAVAQLLNDEGFEIISGTDLIGDIFVGDEVLTSRHPNESEIADIEKGLETARLIGTLDIGQSVVVHDGLILGVECVEGTDALIEKCSKLRKSDRGGILVKVSKPQQDHRLDLPTVGPETIHRLHIHNFSGLAVEAGKCIVINKDVIIKQLNDFSMFFCGIK